MRNCARRASAPPGKLPDFFPPDAGAQMAGRQNQRRLLQEDQGTRAKKNASGSTGRRWSTIRSSRPKFRRARNGQERRRNAASALRMLLGLDGSAPQKSDQSRARSSGRRSRICGLIPPIAFRRFPIPWSKSIAPCAWASTGNWVRSNCGTRPASRPRSRA